MGWNIYRLCDQGEITDGFCLDAVVQVGSKTFDDVNLDESYKYKLLHKFTHNLQDGTTVVADNYFYCPKAMRAAKLKWAKKKRFIFTVPGKFLLPVLISFLRGKVYSLLPPTYQAKLRPRTKHHNTKTGNIYNPSFWRWLSQFHFVEWQQFMFVCW